MENGNVTKFKAIDEAINLWKKYNKSNQFEAEFNELIKEQNVIVQEESFLSRLEFGTAGLRAKMGPGFSRLNDVVIIQTTQGLLKYLREQESDLEKKGIVIGYDGRHFSRRFAELTATIFINDGVPVYMFSRICPTPLVSFAIKLQNLTAGVMITASHNTKEYNGYKLFSSNGCQIISPFDKNVQKKILENLSPWDSSWQTEVLTSSSLLSDPLDSVLHSYYDRVLNSVFDLDLQANSKIDYVYTALHGVGYQYIEELFRHAKIKTLIPVEEQIEPDPEFPTVQNPNPEEGIRAFELAIKTAEKCNSSIIIANDPDADRLGVAEKNAQTGDWKIFSGNELGCLLGWWSIYVHKNRYPNQDIFPDVYLISTIVSSKILKTIAEAEGFQYEETLTGFKWIGNRAQELHKENKQVLFAFEEAIGFMCDSAVLPDKDGIMAAAKLVELVIYLNQCGMRLSNKLSDIYSLYGYHITENSYFICNDKTVQKNIFHRLRNYNGIPCNYPSSIYNDRYKIIRVRDLSVGFDSGTEDKKATLPSSKSNETITFTFDNGFSCTIRTSGTEPKIKYYTELICSPETSDMDVLKAIVYEMVDAVVEEFLQPELNCLIGKR